MVLARGSGVLLHPTSLPGPFAIGDLGPGAYDFVDFLAASGQSYWQVLPLGPTGYLNSPYACASAFAGNPLLVSPERLHDEGLLDNTEFDREIDRGKRGGAETADHAAAAEQKLALLRHSFEAFESTASRRDREALRRFRGHATVQPWLFDYALFMAIKEKFGGHEWRSWDKDVAARRPRTLAALASELAVAVHFHEYVQFQFFRQWRDLKAHANRRGVKLIGDAPIFVAMDSADVWAHRDLFAFRRDGNPASVAGVPPDYFSKTGQLWGNPLYRWERSKASRYRWWIERLRADVARFDAIRIDHFRGFEAYWAVPYGDRTAEHGRWRKGPGAALFAHAEKELGPLPIIAENLGVITPRVEAMRERFGYPGMRVLQFAFDSGPRNPFLPHNYEPHTVVYTGTHDNDTTRGWFAAAPAATRAEVLGYLGGEGSGDGSEIHWDFIRLAFGSVADVAIFPLQDLLGLGSEARMNTPGKASGNWTWRFPSQALTAALAERLHELCRRYNRLGSEDRAPKAGCSP